MNVDTADLGALVEQVAELSAQVAATGRKVTTLTGRVTTLTGRVQDLARLAEIVREAEFGLMLGHARSGAPAPRHAKPRQDRHGLRVVGRGQR